MYEVIGEPPLDKGADQDKSTFVTKEVDDVIDGDDGAVIELVVVTDTDELRVSPDTLTAATLNLYKVPLAKLDTVVLSVELDNVILDNWVSDEL